MKDEQIKQLVVGSIPNNTKKKSLLKVASKFLLASLLEVRKEETPEEKS